MSMARHAASPLVAVFEETNRECSSGDGARDPGEVDFNGDDTVDGEDCGPGAVGEPADSELPESGVEGGGVAAAATVPSAPDSSAIQEGSTFHWGSFHATRGNRSRVPKAANHRRW